MSGQERLTVEQARAKGYLDGRGKLPTSLSAAADARVANREIERLKAELTLLRKILELGHVTRLEHPFHPERKWRFDVALLDVMVALEIEGGIFVPGGGAHQRPKRFHSDMEKYNEAARLGWRVARASWEHVKNGQAFDLVRRFVRETER